MSAASMLSNSDKKAIWLPPQMSPGRDPLTDGRFVAGTNEVRHHSDENYQARRVPTMEVDSGPFAEWLVDLVPVSLRLETEDRRDQAIASLGNRVDKSGVALSGCWLVACVRPDVRVFETGALQQVHHSLVNRALS